MLITKPGNEIDFFVVAVDGGKKWPEKLDQCLSYSSVLLPQWLGARHYKAAKSLSRDNSSTLHVWRPGKNTVTLTSSSLELDASCVTTASAVVVMLLSAAVARIMKWN